MSVSRSGFYSWKSRIENPSPKELQRLKSKLHKYLCIVYSTYQFCINQFFEGVYAVYKALKNICVNYFR